MGTLMQAFHWDCPGVDHRECAWWDFVREKIPSLAKTGFTALWLPPAHKAANLSGFSMGYDPYDYYDLGEYRQKGSVKTWFGSKKELLALIASAHEQRLTVLADLVLNHNSGADEEEMNPFTLRPQWTLFRPRSGKFPRNHECFHPCSWASRDCGTFGQMPDLCHLNPYVFSEILKLARWLIEDIGFDGFRYDFVKGYCTWTVTAIQGYQYQRNGRRFKPYGVAENWDSTRQIDAWIDEINAVNDNQVSAFDFPLRDLLKHLCDSYGFDLQKLPTWDSLCRRKPFHSVTFVENHDTREGAMPIVNDKLLAYGYILTHEGYPCVYWKDYYNWKLGKEGTPHGIAALVQVHEEYAGGDTQVLWVDRDLYIMQRLGHDQHPGLVFVLNNRGDRWNGAWTGTRWNDMLFEPAAWWSGSDLARPMDKKTNAQGKADFWAPPRGYAVYVPTPAA